MQIAPSPWSLDLKMKTLGKLQHREREFRIFAWINFREFWPLSKFTIREI